MPRLGLRWKILTLTTVPLLALAAATLVLVDRGVSQRNEQAVAEDLRRAAGVFENMLSASAAELDIAGAVIVRDPRFFSVMALPHGRNDPDFQATVAGVAQVFHHLAQPDVFEVLDRSGHLITSVGRIQIQPEARRFAASVIAGRSERRAIAQDGTNVLLVATPVAADGRVVGALILGHEVSGKLAARLRELTNSEVSFVYENHITCTTIEEASDLEVVRRASLATEPATSHPVRAGGWVAIARPLPMAAEGTHQLYVLQRSLGAELAFLHSVRSHLFELGLLLLAAVALAAVFIAGHVTRPIRQLVTAASAMEEGEWDVPIDRGRSDEIGYLAIRFDDMRQRQRNYVRSLQEVARAKSEFIAIASHELRTPISIVRGWEDLLRTGLVKPGDAKYLEGLDAIARACISLERIAISATHMTQVEDGDMLPMPASVDVESMIGEALMEANAAAPDRQVAVSYQVEPGARAAVVDRRLVLQAVDHLVRNGIRFTPDGGSVAVRVRQERETLVIEVKDTGIGLTTEARERIFDDAFVARDSRHHRSPRGLEFNVAGLGFGLAFVRRVAEAHGGRVEVVSEEGKGSVFSLHFPGAIAPADAARKAA